MRRIRSRQKLRQKERREKKSMIEQLDDSKLTIDIDASDDEFSIDESILIFGIETIVAAKLFDGFVFAVHSMRERPRNNFYRFGFSAQ